MKINMLQAYQKLFIKIISPIYCETVFKKMSLKE